MFTTAITLFHLFHCYQDSLLGIHDTATIIQVLCPFFVRGNVRHLFPYKLMSESQTVRNKLDNLLFLILQVNFEVKTCLVAL
jgi:hypothetical protein